VRHGIRESTLNVLGRVVVWVVIAVYDDVVVAAWIGDDAAKLSDCNTHRVHTVSAFNFTNQNKNVEYNIPVFCAFKN